MRKKHLTENATYQEDEHAAEQLLIIRVGNKLAARMEPACLHILCQLSRNHGSLFHFSSFFFPFDFQYKTELNWSWMFPKVKPQGPCASWGPGGILTLKKIVIFVYWLVGSLALSVFQMPPFLRTVSLHSPVTWGLERPRWKSGEILIQQKCLILPKQDPP